MQRERITDHIFVFRSDQYAQVTAGLVLTREGAVLIDTLLYPEETMLIRRYIEKGLGASVKYVINTHFHADHTTGTCLFPDARVISHQLCREMLDVRGRESLRHLKENAREFDPVELILPDITFDDEKEAIRIANDSIYGLAASLWTDSLSRAHRISERLLRDDCVRRAPAPLEMGLAPGGLMRQEIYKDEYGIDAWDTSTYSRCFVHIVNSIQLFHLTGCKPPGKPQTAQDYTAAGLPWFDYYGGDLEGLEGAKE